MGRLGGPVRSFSDCEMSPLRGSDSIRPFSQGLRRLGYLDVAAPRRCRVGRCSKQVATIPRMVRSAVWMVPTSFCMVETQFRMVSSQGCWVATQVQKVSTRFCWHPSQFWMVSNISRIVTYLPWMVRNSFRMVRNIQNRSVPIFQGLATIGKTFGTIRSVQNTYTNRLATIRN